MPGPGIAGGHPEQRKRRRICVEEIERLVHDDEADRDLLEDRPGEEARLLAPGPFAGHEAGEAGQRAEDLLALLGGRRRRTGGRPSARLGDSLLYPPELAPLPPPDGEEEEGDQEAGAEGDAHDGLPERRLLGVQQLLADREAHVPRRRALGAEAAGHVDEREVDGRGAPPVESDPVPPRLQDLGAGAVVLQRRHLVGRHVAVGEDRSVGRDEGDPRRGLAGDRADLLVRSGAREEVRRELDGEVGQTVLQVAACPLGDGAVEDPPEDGREEAAEKEPGEDRQDGPPESAPHLANLYPTPTTVSIISSPTFFRSERMWTSTVRVSMSAA